MNRKIILHVGFAKTGTSALQSFMHANKQTLLRDFGILYPGDYANHYHLHSMVSKTPEMLLQMRRESITNRVEALTFLDNFKRNIIEEIHNSSAEIVIFSSEYLSAASHCEKVDIFSFLRKITDDIKIVAYVRDPWSFAISNVQQGIRDGLLTGSVHPGYARNNIETIKAFEHASGIVPIVKPFIPDVEKFDIVDNFLSILNIDRKYTSFSAPADDDTNTSLSFDACCILSTFNELYPAQSIDGLYNVDAARDWASGALQKIKGQRPRLSKITAERIFHESYSDLDSLQNEYFGGEPIFWDAYHRMTFSNGPDLMSLESIAKEVAIKELLNVVYSVSKKCLDLRAWAIHADAEASKLREGKDRA